MNRLWIGCGAIFMMQMCGLAAPAADPTAPVAETIVCIRHGEKPADDLGQLNVQGLNRALALPDVLITKYGKPDFIYAPGTQGRVKRGESDYSYIRPLMTIEPTAILEGLPVHAEFAFSDIAGLQKSVSEPGKEHAVIFIAWEHHQLELFVKSVVSAFGGDPAVVPEWKGKDFDSIYVIKIVSDGGKRRATFQLEHEGLDNLSTEYPNAGRK